MRSFVQSALPCRQRSEEIVQQSGRDPQGSSTLKQGLVKLGCHVVSGSVWVRRSDECVGLCL